MKVYNWNLLLNVFIVSTIVQNQNLRKEDLKILKYSLRRNDFKKLKVRQDIGIVDNNSGTAQGGRRNRDSFPGSRGSKIYSKGTTKN